MSELHTIKNPIGKIFARFKEKVEPIVGVGNVTMDVSKTIAGEKFARLMLMGMPVSKREIDGSEAAVTISCQTEAFCSGTKALSEVYEIDGAIHSVMVGMGFHRTYGGELTTNIDSSIKRVVSRYSMVYASSLLGEGKEDV